MRHLNAGKRLGVTTSHRKAMMRNLVTALLEHGEIKTTITRAKEMRRYFDRMIGLGKKADLHARRQALSYIKSKDVVQKLFEEYGPLYENRNGGYTRIYRLGRRLGDNAEMVLMQMVDLKEQEPKKAKKAASEAISEIKKELRGDESAKETATEGSAQGTAAAEKGGTETSQAAGSGSAVEKGGEPPVEEAEKAEIPAGNEEPSKPE